MKRTGLVLPLLALLILLSALPGLAQDAEAPTVAILRFGDGGTYDATEVAILEVLQSYGLLSEEENKSERGRLSVTNPRVDIQGEKLNIIWGEAGFDLATANLMVEDALNREADVIVTLTTAVTQLAVNATSAMEEPTPVLFTSVFNPYRAGIAQSACIKPAHVTGSETRAPLAEVLRLMLLQDPELDTVGAIYHSSDAMGVHAVEELNEAAEEHGLGVDVVAIATLADLRHATLGLLERGAGAIIPLDLLSARGLPIVLVLANQYGVPVFYPSTAAIYVGATVGAGNYAYFNQGTNVGVMLVHYLQGELDIATTGINISSDWAVALNLDSAAAQDVEIVPELREMAEVVIESGKLSHISQRLADNLTGRGAYRTEAERADDDDAYLASLHCSPERIAGEQAALDGSA